MYESGDRSPRFEKTPQHCHENAQILLGKCPGVYFVLIGDAQYVPATSHRRLYSAFMQACYHTSLSYHRLHFYRSRPNYSDLGDIRTAWCKCYREGRQALQQERCMPLYAEMLTLLFLNKTGHVWRDEYGIFETKNSSEFVQCLFEKRASPCSSTSLGESV